MFLMTQIAVYQHKDGTIGIGRTNDLRQWWLNIASDFKDSKLIAAYPIAWQWSAVFQVVLKERLKDKLVSKDHEGSQRKSYDISVDELYKVFSKIIEELQENTYIPSTMLEPSKNSIPKYEIWNFDYTPIKMFEIRVNT